jgi:tetratricopeptide (TPR) repeat protein
MRIMKPVALLAIAVAAISSAGAQVTQEKAAGRRADPAAAAVLRTRGLELGYNLDHEDAIAAFEQTIAADPSGAAAYRLLAATTWISMLFQQGAITVDDFLGQARANLPRSAPAQASSRRFHDSLGHAIRIAEQQLRERPDDADAHFQVGAAYGFMASYTATVEGRLVGSLGSARRAYREHQRVLSLDPDRKDAGLIVGMYRYAVSELSVPLRLGAYLAGLGGGRARGLRMVEDAARYPSDVQANAQFTLILLYNRAARYDDALRVIVGLQRRYPRNRLLWLEAGGTALRAGRPAEARAALEEGLARLSRDDRPRAPGEDARWRYTYGATLVALKDVAPAARELRAALDGAVRDWLRGRIHKELGKLADLAGDRARAREEYQLADRLCRQDRDAACSDELRSLKKKGYR